jgi:hypothetical protein
MRLNQELVLLSMSDYSTPFSLSEPPENYYIIQNSSHTFEKASFSVIFRPFERMMVRYKALPLNLAQIVRLEKTKNVIEKFEMIHHNSMAKLLLCRRQIWSFSDTFAKNGISSASIEYMLQTLMRLRLSQGFSIAFNQNGITTVLLSTFIKYFSILVS